jgi:hypothetical protein
MKAIARTYYHLECRDAQGNLKWVDTIKNLVVTAGLNKLLSACFKDGLASPAWYVGLVGVTHTYAAGDTLATHTGWAENAHYSGNRQALNVSGNTIAAGVLSNSANKATFTFAGTANPDTINGCFLCDAATGTSGTLYGAGDLSVSRPVNDSDVLTITVTLTVAAG